MGFGQLIEVILQGVLDLGEYAASLIEVGNDEQAEYTRQFNEWMDYYARLRMTGIGQGVIIMRKTSGRPNWPAISATTCKLMPGRILFRRGETRPSPW